MYTLIYKHNYRDRKRDEKTGKIDLLRYDIAVQEFIVAAIEYAKKSAGRIIICNDDGNIYADIYIKIGMFFGGFKEKFLNLADKSEDFLILPEFGSDDATLKIRFYRIHSLKNLKEWLNE